MNLLKISVANIRHKPLRAALSIILMAFGVGMISLLYTVQTQFQEQFDRNIKDIDMVLGAKGSPLQLILSSVYQVDAPTGNINLQETERFLKNPLVKGMVKEWIPMSYGDNFQKYRIVGTEHAYAEHYSATVAQGRLYEADFEVTLGSKVAQETGLQLGDTFFSAHGLDDTTDVHKNHAFKVVGVFEPSRTVVDNLVLCNIPSIWRVHEKPDEPPLAEEDKEITAVLVKTSNLLASVRIPGMLRDSKIMVSLPAIEVNRLNKNFGIGMDAFTAIGVLIMILSAVSVFIALYSSLRERRYELALMRTMGGRRSTILTMIVMEGALMSLIGFVVGWVLSRIGLLVLSAVLEDRFHYGLTDLAPSLTDLGLLMITIFVGKLASLLPAVKAMRIDISNTLADG